MLFESKLDYTFDFANLLICVPENYTHAANNTSYELFCVGHVTDIRCRQALAMASKIGRVSDLADDYLQDRSNIVAGNKVKPLVLVGHDRVCFLAITLDVYSGVGHASSPGCCYAKCPPPPC